MQDCSACESQFPGYVDTPVVQSASSAAWLIRGKEDTGAQVITVAYERLRRNEQTADDDNKCFAAPY